MNSTDNNGAEKFPPGLADSLVWNHVLMFLLFAAGYVFTGNFILKFAFLCLAAWMLFRHMLGNKSWQMFFTGLGVFLFSAAFLLNPMFSLVSKYFSGSFPQGTAFILVTGSIILFIILGVVWTVSAFPMKSRIRGRPLKSGNYPVIICLLILFIAIFAPSWQSPLAYCGDELYHGMTIFAYQLVTYQLAAKFTVLAIILIWVLVGVLLAIPFKRSPWVKFAWICAGFIIMALVPMNMGKLMNDPFIQGRIARYPAAEAWVSTVLGMFSVKSWARRDIIPLEIMRFLPIFSLFLLGMTLVSDWRARKLPVVVTVVSVLAMLTVPDLMFHGTIVYLELPAIMLAVIMLLDCKKLLSLPYPRVCCRPSWFAIVFLGFTKETAFPMLLAFVAVRVLFRCLDLRRDSVKDMRGFVYGEVLVAVAACLPAVLYMLIRSLSGARPYGAHFLNLFDITLLHQFVSSLGVQFGALLLPAVWGVYLQIRRKQWRQLTLAGLIFVGMSVFFMGENEQYIGMARFNLLLLPPLIFWAWEGLMDLFKIRFSLGVLAVLLVILCNIVLSPVDSYGRRMPWGKTEEFWYDFPKAFKYIRNRNENATIMMGNMATPYNVFLAKKFMNWENNNIFRKFYKQPDKDRELLQTLVDVKKYGLEYVIFRWQGEKCPLNRLEYPGFKLLKDFPCRGGGLLLYQNTKQPVQGRKEK